MMPRQTLSSILSHVCTLMPHAACPLLLASAAATRRCDMCLLRHVICVCYDMRLLRHVFAATPRELAEVDMIEGAWRQGTW